MSKSRRLGVIATQKKFSYLLSLGPNLSHRVTKALIYQDNKTGKKYKDKVEDDYKSSS